jgi:hypothetical protein
LTFDGVIYNANSCGVVNVDGSGWLWVDKFFKEKTYDLGLLGIEEDVLFSWLTSSVSLTPFAMHVTFYLTIFCIL